MTQASKSPTKGTDFDYAGCVSLPRCLSLTPDGRLHQAPLPEVALLRSGWGAGAFIAGGVAGPAA